MAITGSLQLGPAGEGSHNWRIINMTYEFFQPVDRFGQPNGRVDGGFINMTVESSASDIDLIHWMLSNRQVTDGGAFFFDRNGRLAREVAFQDAFCVYYKEIYDAHNDSFMKIDFRISCREITINNGGAETTLAKDWTGFESSASGTASSSSSSTSSSSSSGEIGSFNPND